MKDLEIEIKKLSEKKKISLRELSRKIDMSYQNLYRCFKKGSIVTSDLEKIAAVFGVPVSHFFEDINIDIDQIPIVSEKEIKYSDKTSSNRVDELIRQNGELVRQVSELIKMQLLNAESIRNLSGGSVAKNAGARH